MPGTNDLKHVYIVSQNLVFYKDSLNCDHCELINLYFPIF